MSHSPAPRRVVLARRPMGIPRIEDFRLETTSIASLAAGECLVANRFLSMDPAIRGFLDDRPSYLPPLAIGATVRGMTLGRVQQSRNAALPEGAYVRALAGWEDFSLLSPDALGLERLDPASGIPLQMYMGALGPAGLTAWIGLNEVGRIKSGQTVLVSAAAGAVGSVAGQIARLQGCRAVGLVGSAVKLAYLKELGFHEAVNYRAAQAPADGIRAACPEGIDLYFDNVGGALLESVLPLMNVHGFVLNCGMIGDYNHQDSPQPVRTLWQMVVKRLTMRGFLTYEHADRIPEAQAQLAGWVQSGALVGLENIHEGLEAAAATFIELMSGQTVGKTLVRLPE